MNPRHIDVFRAIMQVGTAARAAELLETSQPSISRALADLELQVGFRLFDRIKNRLVPTQEGQLFFAEVLANEVGLSRLTQAAVRIREVGAGLLRIATMSALGHSLVPKAIARFLSEHPRVRIAYQVRTSSVVRELVSSGRFDIGLAADEIDTTGLDYSVFATPRAVCVLPRRHRLAGRKVIVAADLNDEPFLALSPEDTARKSIDRAFASEGVAPRIIVETPYSLTIALLAAEGAGVGITNPLAIRGMEHLGFVVRHFEPAVHFRALLIRPPQAPTAELVRAFTAELMRERNAAR